MTGVAIPVTLRVTRASRRGAVVTVRAVVCYPDGDPIIDQDDRPVYVTVTGRTVDAALDAAYDRAIATADQLS